jgi:predicted dehydrogenase
MRWKIGVLGLIHDHVWEHVAELQRRGDVALAVAEPFPALRARAESEYGVRRLYPAYDQMLERERPDAVLIFTDNAGTADLVELAAAHGRPMLSEKPMADNLANAERMRVAANNSGFPLMVNWPTNWNAAIRHALGLAAGGAIGDVYRFSFRGGHGGPKEFGCTPEFYEWLYDRARNGAGAYIDYCGYGASMARLLLGMPSRAQAAIGRLQKEYVDVDDNAVLLLRYQHAMAVIEATWTAAGRVPDGGPAIWGSDGTLVVRRAGDRGSVQHISADRPDGVMLEPPELPEGARTATSYFLTCLADDRPIEGLVSLQVGRDTQEILEAGLLAARDSREVSLPLDVL